ncbi:MAG: HU family DNA-binding protein [Elusimicrobiaceae bacterium]|jgi:nucleoid DNA-binding protein|nr:HU family DNA-binding protein [Elusimicrobiaceae bacterium]
MNKEELIKELSNYLFDKQQAKIAVDRTLEIIKENLQKGEKVVLSNFGSFKVRQSAPLVLKNPKGQIVEVPSKKRVRFKPSENILK